MTIIILSINNHLKENKLPGEETLREKEDTESGGRDSGSEKRRLQGGEVALLVVPHLVSSSNLSVWVLFSSRNCCPRVTFASPPPQPLLPRALLIPLPHHPLTLLAILMSPVHLPPQSAYFLAFAPFRIILSKTLSVSPSRKTLTWHC